MNFLMAFAVQPDIFEEITKLIEFIPIESVIPSSAKFSRGVTILSRFSAKNVPYIMYMKKLNLTNIISFKDIIRLFNLCLKDNRQKITIFQRFDQLKQIGATYPIEYLLFDFCLAALEGDTVDSKLYLAHSYHILGLRNSFNLLLSLILNESLTEDVDIREFLLLLARAVEPRNARTYIHAFGQEYRSRLERYLNESSKIDTFP